MVVVLLRITLIAFLAQISFAQPASTRASALIDAGVELSNRGRFNEAGEKFVQALALDPESAEAHYLLGLVRQQSGRNDAALASFRSALRIHPRYAAAQARVCELMTVSARTRDGGFESAKEACRRAITLDPRDPEPHFHLGWNESKLGNRLQSTQEYQTVLRLDPTFPRAKFELAMTYLDTQQTEHAIPLLKDVIASEPGNGNAKYQLGAALAKQGDCSSAIPLLESATESAQTEYVLAGCYKKVHRDADARASMAKVRHLREGADERMQAKYRASVAHKYAETGQLEKAIVEYRAALALVNDGSIKIDLAVALLKKGEPEEAVSLLEGEADPLARYQLGLAYFKLGRLDEAAGSPESVVQARPDFAEAWYQLGLSSLGLRRPAEAEIALRNSARLRPDEPAIRLAWAEALEQLGRPEEARDQRTLAARTAK